MGLTLFVLLFSLIGISVYLIAEALMIVLEYPFMVSGRVTDNGKFICWVNLCLNTVLPFASMILQARLPGSLTARLSADARYVITLVFVMVVIRTLLKFWLYGMISKASKQRILAMTFLSNLVSGLLIFCFFRHAFF